MADRLLIRMPNWLGDVVMATSAIEALHRTGKYSLHVLIRSPWDELFRSDPRVSEVIVCEDRGGGLWSTASALKGRSFGAVVDFTHSPRSRLLWGLAGIKQIYREKSGPNATGPRPGPNSASVDAAHQVRRYVSVIEDLISSPAAMVWPPSVFAPSDPDKGPAGEAACPSERPPVGGGEILIFPSAAYGPAKQWSTDHYRRLVTQLSDRGFPVRLLGTQADRGPMDQILQGLDRAGVSATAGLPIRDLLQVILHARAVISCDSGAAHLAAALHRPVVVLFFSTDPARTSPIGYAVRPLTSEVPCRPCYLRTCPIGYLCRDALTPERVLAQLDDVFDVPLKSPGRL